jgi:hypothetical protein
VKRFGTIGLLNQMPGRGMEFEEYDTSETDRERVLRGRRMEARGLKDSEGNLVGVVRALA